MLSKTSDNAATSYQWKSAINLLRNAREIWIVGYGFPQTDAFMSRLLCEAVQDYSDLEFIAVVNIEKKSVFEPRLQELFNSNFYRTKVKYYELKAADFFKQLSEKPPWESGSTQLPSIVL